MVKIQIRLQPFKIPDSRFQIQDNKMHLASCILNLEF